MEASFLERITLDPNICHGKPCIRSLRYPVEFVLELYQIRMIDHNKKTLCPPCLCGFYYGYLTEFDITQFWDDDGRNFNVL